MRKLVKAANRVGNDVRDHEFGEAAERKAMHAGAETLLDSPN